MKRLKSFSIIILLFVLGLTMNPKSANAKSGIIQLKENKTYKCDLNGDKKKEKIKVINKRTNTASLIYSDIYFYINGKKVFSRRVEYAGEAIFCIADIDKKDKYKEIVVRSQSGISYGTEDFFAVQFRDSKKIAVYNSSRCSKNGQTSIRRGIPKSKYVFRERNGKVYTMADTPYYCSSFGCYFAYIQLGLKGNKLILKETSKYKLVPISEWENDIFKSGYRDYTLAHDVKIYNKPSKASKSSQCKSGTRFTALYLKPLSKNTYKGNAFVKVRTSRGQIGWIYFRNTLEGGMLVRTPGWS